MAENCDIQLLQLQYQSPPMFLFSQPPPSFPLAKCNTRRQINKFFKYSDKILQLKTKKQTFMHKLKSNIMSKKP
jgi:hypothetical protein